MFFRRGFLLFAICAVLTSIALVGCFISRGKSPAHDWPAWRYDAKRSAASPQELPERLHLQWVREYPKLDPAWENPLNQDLMPFDRGYEPIVLGRTLFVGSNARDALIAIDTRTGREKWAFAVDGPLRLPPIAANGRVYFTSDDGYLYCIDAGRGELVWRFQGALSARKILGNERLISTWPARGGPVVQEGVVYFAAGIWPFMGIALYALDAETGEEIWVNERAGVTYMQQPHNSPSYAGIAPQGSFVVAGDRLLVPGGRSVPACFNRHTGELEYYHLAKFNKTGGAFVCAAGGRFVNYHRDGITSLYDLATGERLIPRFGGVPVMTDESLYCAGATVQAFDLANLRQEDHTVEVKDRQTQEMKEVIKQRWVLDQLWECEIDASGDLIQAGSRLYAGSEGRVSAIDLPNDTQPARVSWSAEVEGSVHRLIAADDRLFAVTLEGRLYAFGKEEREPAVYRHEAEETELSPDALAQADSILETTGVTEGYCLAYGIREGEVAEALARRSDLRVIAVTPDPDERTRLRRRWYSAGLYGKKLSIQSGEPTRFEAPRYLASLLVFETLSIPLDVTFIEHIYRSLRPYGGVACLPVPRAEQRTVSDRILACELDRAHVESVGDYLLLKRTGSLPGSASWTHQYGDIANSVKSNDQRVRLPLGILWFGGNSNVDVLPRHGHGPPEQVVGGRLFIEGIDSLSARDVYTGRVLWTRSLTDLGNFGVYYDSTYRDTPLDPAYNQVHIPGANARGTNFVATADRVYILVGSRCLALDPATGETLKEFTLPSKNGRPTEWGYLGVYKDYLIGGAGLMSYTHHLEPNPKLRSDLSAFLNFDITSSRELIVMDRHTGQVLWNYPSRLGLRHSAIAVGNGRLFCIDAMPPLVIEAMRKQGDQSRHPARLAAFDLQTGEHLWSNQRGVFGTWLGYSAEHDILLQAGRGSRDMLRGEPTESMAAYRGTDGKPLWREDGLSYGGPCILHGEAIITDRNALDLHTGNPVLRTHALTGARTPWFFQRNYGCNYAIASEHLLTFRSAAAGFFDLASDGGTGNFGGFKSGCTSNLIAADGVLNAPEYTRTCSCSYQNQTSLALVHDPEVEIWADYPEAWQGNAIQRLGINLGAPGDRMAEDGTLWLEYPRVGGPSPDVPVTFQPENPQTFYRHSSRIEGTGLKWVVASGVEGVSAITIPVIQASAEAALPEATPSRTSVEVQEGEAVSPASRYYTVRLYFAELAAVAPGERVFDVFIQDEQRIEGLDIVQQAGGRFRPLVKEFRGIPADREIKLSFRPLQGAAIPKPTLCGIAILTETDGDIQQTSARSSRRSEHGFSVSTTH